MSGEILYFSENRDFAGEISSAAKQLAAAVGGRAMEVQTDQAGDRAHGDSIVLKADQQLSNNPEITANAIAALARQRKPSVILIGSTRLGRQVAARLAVQLRTGALSDVRNLAIEGGLISGDRAVYAGKFLSKVSAALPCVATVPAGAYEEGPTASGSVETVGVDVSGKVRRVETRPKPKATVDLKSAAIIVSAGRGFKTKEDLILVERLAAAMGGVVGSSRPLTSDLGWLGEEHHIGLTGFYVHPDLYLAIGISGQLQHVAGIKDSKIIAAINKDRQAPIFQVADYGIVGDLYQVVPALLNLLEKKTS